MKLSNQQLQIARKAKTEEELLALAKEWNIDCAAEDAKKFFQMLHKTEDLTDDELNNVSGGSCESYDYPDMTCPKCGSVGMNDCWHAFSYYYVCPKCYKGFLYDDYGRLVFAKDFRYE